MTIPDFYYDVMIQFAYYCDFEFVKGDVEIAKYCLVALLRFTLADSDHQTLLCLFIQLINGSVEEIVSVQSLVNVWMASKQIQVLTYTYLFPCHPDIEYSPGEDIVSVLLCV